MTRAEPSDFVRHPVDVIAQLILQDALDDLSLVKRTRGSANSLRVNKTLLPLVQHQFGPPLTFASDTDLANKQYLEQLVSIAVASAEHADDILMKARATHAKAVRTIGVFAAIATVGMTVGVLGMVASLRGHAADQNLADGAGQIPSLEQQRQSTNHELAAVNYETAGHNKDITTTMQTAEPAQMDTSDPQEAVKQRVIMVPYGQPIVATPLRPLHEATYSPPWPEPVVKGQSATWPQSLNAAHTASYSSLWPSRPYHGHSSSTPPGKRVRVPEFFAAIQRSLRTLFR